MTIVARGAAGGYTKLLPDEERSLLSKGQFKAMLAVMMGGQTAEELMVGDITTGASNDLQKASEVARRMVTEFGMSEELGPRTFNSGPDMVFLGKELSQKQNYSDAIAEKIDAEIGSLLHRAQQTAKTILQSQSEKLTLIAKRLLLKETIEGPELQELLGGSLEEAPLAT